MNHQFVIKLLFIMATFSFNNDYAYSNDSTTKEWLGKSEYFIIRAVVKNDNADSITKRLQLVLDQLDTSINSIQRNIKIITTDIEGQKRTSPPLMNFLTIMEGQFNTINYIEKEALAIKEFDALLYRFHLIPRVTRFNFKSEFYITQDPTTIFQIPITLVVCVSFFQYDMVAKEELVRTIFQLEKEFKSKYVKLL